MMRSGKKDFVQRLRIARREAKESMHWLALIAEANASVVTSVRPLIKESEELKNILSLIIMKATP